MDLNNAVKTISIFTVFMASAGFVFAVITENSSSEFTEILTGFGDPVISSMGLILVPVALLVLYKTTL